MSKFNLKDMWSLLKNKLYSTEWLSFYKWSLLIPSTLCFSSNPKASI